MAASDFGTNKFHIKNKEGREITDSYLHQYIQCCCRKDYDFVGDEARTKAFRFFRTDEFLAPLAAKGYNACQVGDAAAIHPIWMELGVTPKYTNAQRKRIAERNNMVLTAKANTAEGQADIIRIRERNAEIAAAAAWKTRREAILHWDKNQLKKMLSLDPDLLPEPLATEVRKLKEDFAKLQLELKAEAAARK